MTVTDASDDGGTAEVNTTSENAASGDGGDEGGAGGQVVAPERASDDDGAAPHIVEGGEDPSDGEVGGGPFTDRSVRRLALALTLAPFLVGVVALVFAVGNQYHPWSDHALTELQTRSVGRDEVLVGLYSREEWNHPGPALFYLLAPVYWLTGGMSVAISIGALLINGAAVAGMALVARRIGGTPLMLVTLLGNALLMRMLSAEFLQDPWNCFVTTLPFGLLIFLTWAMWRGEMWAFPVAAGVFTFLAQAHVGFVALASPLLAWGAAGLVWSVATARAAEGDATGGARRTWGPVARSGLVGVVVLVVGWLPVAFDALRNDPSNTDQLVDYFRHPGDEAHTLADGWRVMSGQFGGLPEWLTYKHDPSFGGESPFLASAPFPWMMLLVVAAGVVLWRRRVAGGRALLGTLAVTFVVGIVAVSRTVGPAFDYRLRWTYIPAMVAFVAVGWAAWSLAVSRWPRSGERVLGRAALAGLVVLSGVNVFTAATAGTPQDDDSAAVASLSDQVLDYLSGREGTVYINDQMHSGAWHARGLLLQLEREGYDVGVHESLVNEYGEHRVHPDPALDSSEPVTVLYVTRDEYLPQTAERPGMRMIAEWRARPQAEIDALLAEHAAIGEDMDAGRISVEEGIDRRLAISAELTHDGESTAWHAAVFIDDGSGTVAPPAG